MSNNQSEKAVAAWRGACFITLQVVFVALAIGAIRGRLQATQSRPRLPSLRRVPVQIEPLYDRPSIVGDGPLAAVLQKLRPRLRGPKPEINHVDHALRFWRVEATFDDPSCISGREMRDILLNHAKFLKFWGPHAKPLLNPGAEGIRVRTQQGIATASHVDHTLAGLAEVGTSLDLPVQTPAGRSSLRYLLEYSLRTFSLNQVEYEWSALAYALYLQSGQPWITSEGQEITFDRIAERIMRQRLSQGVCYGNHRLHALVILLRVDDKHSILSPSCRAEIVRHLQKAVSTLIRSQHASGYWNENWARGTPPSDDDDGGRLDPLSARLLATGHAMEWLAMAPTEIHPPREILVSAGRWLSDVIIDMDDQKVKENYTFLTHAGAALALWRRRFPADFLTSTHAGHCPDDAM